MEYSLIMSATLRTTPTLISYMSDYPTVAIRFHKIALDAASTNSPSMILTALEVPAWTQVNGI